MLQVAWCSVPFLRENFGLSLLFMFCFGLYFMYVFNYHRSKQCIWKADTGSETSVLGLSKQLTGIYSQADRCICTWFMEFAYAWYDLCLWLIQQYNLYSVGGRSCRLIPMSRSPGVSSRPAVGCSCSPGSAVPPARHHTSSSCCPFSSGPQGFPRETGETSNQETLPHFCALVVQTSPDTAASRGLWAVLAAAWLGWGSLGSRGGPGTSTGTGTSTSTGSGTSAEPHHGYKLGRGSLACLKQRVPGNQFWTPN